MPYEMDDFEEWRVLVQLETAPTDDAARFDYTNVRVDPQSH